MSSNLGPSPPLPFPVSYSLYPLAGGWVVGGLILGQQKSMVFFSLFLRTEFPGKNCLRPHNSRSVYTEAKKMMYMLKNLSIFLVFKDKDYDCFAGNI